MPELKFSTSDHTEVVAAFDKARKAADEMAEGVQGVNEQLKLNAKEAKQLDKLQQDIARRNESAADTYVRKINETKRAVSGHKDEVRLLKAETFRLTDEYIKSAEKQKTLTTQQRAELKKLKQANSEIAAELGIVEDATEDAYGSGAQEMVTGMVGRLGGVLSIVKLITEGYQDQRRAIEAAREAAVNRAPGVGELKQLANSQAEYDQLIGLSNRLHTGGAVKSQDDALQATFTLASVGATDEASVRLWEQLGQQGIVDIGSASKSMQTWATSFGKEEAGSATQMLSKAFQVAEKAPGSVEDVMEAVAGVGSVANSAGITDEEVGAGISVLSQSIGTPAEARTALEAFVFSTEEDKRRLNALEQAGKFKSEREDLKRQLKDAKKWQKQAELRARIGELDRSITEAQTIADSSGLTGMSLGDRVRRIQSWGLTTAELKGTLGRKEAFRAYSNLALNLPAYEADLAAVQGANTDTSVIDRKLSLRDAGADMVLQAKRRKAILEQQNQLQGAAEEFITAYTAETSTEMQRKGRELFGDNAAGAGASHVATAIAKTIEWFERATNTPMELVDQIANNPTSTLSEEEKASARALIEQQKQLDKQLEEMRKQTSLLQDIKNDRSGGLVGEGT